MLPACRPTDSGDAPAIANVDDEVAKDASLRELVSLLSVPGKDDGSGDSGLREILSVLKKAESDGCKAECVATGDPQSITRDRTPSG